MSKYNLLFKIERIDDENSYITHGVGGCDVKALPLDNIKELINIFIAHAEESQPAPPAAKEGE